MKKKAFLINFFFFLAIAISIFFIKQFMDTNTVEKQKNRKDTPDAYMVNATYLRTNESGQREVTIFSPFVTHYKERDRSNFQKPIIHVVKNDEKWIITSKNAQGMDGVKTFYLYNDVRVRQLPSKKNSNSTVMTTQSLTVFPKENLVTTKDFVTIEQPGLKISAIGLRGNLDTGDIQLLSKTRGLYDPKQPH